MASTNKALVLRWFDEVWNQRRSETIDELMNEESVCYEAQGPMRGPDGFRQQQYEPLLRAFPDLRVEVEAIIEEGDDVVVRWTASGTHTGDSLPVQPTGRTINCFGMSWIRIHDGKLGEGWQASNISEVLRGLTEEAPVG